MNAPAVAYCNDFQPATSENLSFHINTGKLLYTEDELVEGLKLRNQTVFSYFYYNYAPALNGAICKIVNNRQCSEDVLQEVFIKVWEHIHTYDKNKGRLFTWIHSLAINKSIDFVRSKHFKKRKKTDITDCSIPSSNMPEYYSNDTFDAIGMNRKVAKLKPVSMKLINMAYYEGLTHTEIAKELAMPLGTVKTRIRTAINELKAIRFAI